MDFQIVQKDIDDIVDCVEGAIEKLLMIIKVKLEFQSDPELMAKRQAQMARLNEKKENKVKVEKKPDEVNRKGKLKGETTLVKKEENLEKQLYEKNQKITELSNKIQLLEQKLKNCEELLVVKDDKIRLLQKSFK